jgi:CelD/BcsL family acetyltransferase involved in cellulose biosynthesis
VLSILYVGDKIAAIHLGMRSHHVLHSWFPAYNTDLSRWSPGVVIFLKLAQIAEEQGITHLELGKGDDCHKQRLMTDFSRVAEGTVESNPLVGRVRRQLKDFKNYLRDMDFPTGLSKPAKALKRLRQRLLFQ